MDDRLVRKLAELAGRLQPSPQASLSDLRIVRLLLAESLLRRPSVSLSTENVIADLVTTTVEDLEASTVAELRSVFAEVERNVGTAPGGIGEARIFRRDAPLPSVEIAGSSPAWAAGAAIDRTLGPFLTPEGRRVWFDVYRFARFVPVVRLPGGAPLLFLSLRDAPRDGTTYAIGSGSVWINARLVAASAPPGSHSGLRVAGGTLKLSQNATVAAGAIHVPPAARLTLTLKLQPSVVPRNSSGPGADAREGKPKIPRDMTFVFSPQGATVAAKSDFLCSLYGVNIQLRLASGPPAYEPSIGRVLFPCEFKPRTLSIRTVHSDFFEPSGSSRIEAAAWAIPITEITGGTSLPEAAGVGAMAVVTPRGMRARWRGLFGGTVELNRTFFLVESQRFSVIAPTTGTRRAAQVFDLWHDNAHGQTRRCSLEMHYDKAAALTYISGADGQEVLTYAGTAVPHLDRPLRADGRRLGIQAGNTRVVFAQDAEGVTISALALLGGAGSAPPASKPLVFALANALLKTTPPEALVAFGVLKGDRAVVSGYVSLHFGLRLITPILPDPYASNVRNPREVEQGHLTARFTAFIQWPSPEAPQLTLSLKPLKGEPLPVHAAMAGTMEPTPGRVTGNEGDPHRREGEDAVRVAKLRGIFDAALGSASERVFLLDVSSHADQFGVGFGVAGSRNPDTIGTTHRELTIEGMDLATPARNIRVFTVPQIQWEPVWTIQNPNLGNFPSPLASANDGGPTLLGINTVNLVPIAPHPCVAELVQEFRRGDLRTRAAALFTLPFGLKAIAAPLRKPPEPIMPGASLQILRPEFRNPKLRGGLQISLTAINPPAAPGVESPALPGATVQTRNGLDPATNPPRPISVLGDTAPPSPSGDNTANAVESIFNGEFAPGGANPRVPLSRIDFSGYGASTFSHWRNPKAQFAQTSKVEFQVMVGRTGHEVIQVRSILYPWGVRVVRTITIQRTGGGGVFRRDSGWIAVTDGVFDFAAQPSPLVIPEIQTHPGVVKGAFNVRRIRDTSDVFHRKYTTGGTTTEVRLTAVRFDAEVRIAGVVRGGKDGLVTSVDQLGFVQLAPSGKLLTAEQYAELLDDQGPLGGPVDCVMDVGGSGQRMRVTRVDVSTARSASRIEFAAAARGSLVLPRDGQWSIVRQPAGVTKEAEPVDPHAGVPLVRQGEAGLDDGANSNPYRFADPADVLEPNNPVSDYGLLWSTGIKRVLFLRPKIDNRAKQITSARKPLLADPYSLANSSAIFPAAGLCLEIPFPSWALEIVGDAQFRLALPPELQAIKVTGGVQRDLSSSATSRMYVDYTNTRITLALDPAGAPSWSFAQTGVATVHEMDGAKVSTSRGDFTADSASAAKFTLMQHEFGEALDEAKPLMELFSSNSLGGLIPQNPGISRFLETEGESHGKTGFKLEIGIPIPPKIPLLIGYTEHEGSIKLFTNFKDFLLLELEVELLLGNPPPFLIPGAAMFKLEVGKNPKGGNWGGKLLLAIGINGEGKVTTVPFVVTSKCFLGIGFEQGLGTTTTGIGYVFEAEVAIGYPSPIPLAEVGLSAEGKLLLEFRNGDPFGVARAKLAAEITLAVFLTIEFELPEMTILEVEL
jgi:hypothetical protein